MTPSPIGSGDAQVRPGDRLLVIVAASVLAATAVVAYIAFGRRAADPPAGQSMAGAFPAAPGPRDNARAREPEPASRLMERTSRLSPRKSASPAPMRGPMITREPAPEAAPREERRRPPGRAQDGSGPGPRRAARRESAGSDRDSSVLAAAFGGWDDTTAEKIGAKTGMLSRLAAKVLKHPKVLRALFDNKLVVKAYMNRGLVRRNCSDSSALKSYLMDGNSPGGVKEDIAVIQSFTQDKQAAMAFAGSELANSLARCPSVTSLARSPGAVQDILTANPSMAGLMSHPVLIQGIASNPRAAALYGQAKSQL